MHTNGACAIDASFLRVAKAVGQDSKLKWARAKRRPRQLLGDPSTTRSSSAYDGYNSDV